MTGLKALLVEGPAAH